MSSRWRRLVLTLLPALSGGFWSKRPAVPKDGLVCDDGWVAVERDRLEDDFCDCADGSDEVRTSACASTKTKKFFTCENEGYDKKSVRLSVVNDAVCDCCDGSDEAPGECENLCDAEAAAERALREKLRRMRADGLRKRAEYVALAATQLAEDARDYESAKAQIAELDEFAKARRERVALLERELKERQEQLQREAEAKATARRDAAFAELLHTSDQALTAATTLAATFGEIEALLDATTKQLGHEADGLDDVEILSVGIDANEAFTNGDFGAFETHCARLYEALTLDQPHGLQVQSATTLLTDVASAVTRSSEDNAKDRLASLEANVRDSQLAVATVSIISFAAAGDEHVCAAADGECQGPETVAALKAELSEKEALKKTASETVKRIDKDRLFDFGPDNAFFALKDKCVTQTLGKYDWEICAFANAKQDRTSIGNFKSWSGDDEWHFENGAYCNGVGARTLTVRLACGDDEAILDVAEKETCKYEASLQTPAACRPSSEDESLDGAAGAAAEVPATASSSSSSSSSEADDVSPS